MGVSLAVTHNIGDMEPEEAASYGQAGTLVEWGTSTQPQNLFCLYEMQGVETEGPTNNINNQPNLRHIL